MFPRLGQNLIRYSSESVSSRGKRDTTAVGQVADAAVNPNAERSEIEWHPVNCLVECQKRLSSLSDIVSPATDGYMSERGCCTAPFDSKSVERCLCSSHMQCLAF